MKRYDMHYEDVYENEDGEWVRYADVEKELTELRHDKELLTKALNDEEADFDRLNNCSINVVQKKDSRILILENALREIRDHSLLYGGYWSHEVARIALETV